MEPQLSPDESSIVLRVFFAGPIDADGEPDMIFMGEGPELEHLPREVRARVWRRIVKLAETWAVDLEKPI